MVDYNDPLIRIVYLGLPRSFARLHLLELGGVRRYVSMTDEQCQELLSQEPGTFCVPIALSVEESARSRTKLLRKSKEQESGEERQRG